MTMININPNNEDPFNRYQMPKLVVKIDSKGYGMKTTLLNLSAIAKDLHRPPTYLAQYLCYKLSTPVKTNTKEDLYIIKGGYDRETLQNYIYDFIEQFVLCLKCSNPETNLDVRKYDEAYIEVYQICISCGHSRLMDTKAHKLTNYIAKHSPSTESKSKKTMNSKYSDRQSSNELNQKTITAMNSDALNHVDNDDDDWGEDTDLHKSLHQRCDIYRHLIENKKTEQKLNDIETIKDLIAEAERLKIIGEAAFIVGQCIFTENILKDINEHKLLLSKLCTKNPKGQIYLLHALEVLIDKNEEIRRKNFNENTISKILSKFYDEDIIEEDAFYAWYTRTSKYFIDELLARQIRVTANRFIEWLRTAEETSDIDDEK